MQGQSKSYVAALIVAVLLAGATAALGQEVTLIQPRDGDVVRATVLVQATKPDPASGWVSFLLSGGSLARPELVAAVAPPGGGRTLFEHRWDTAETVDGKRRFADDTYTLTMMASGPTGESLGQQSIKITIQNGLGGRGGPGMQLLYLYPKNREVPYDVVASAKLSSGDEDSWPAGAGGGGGYGSEGGGGYGMSGASGYGGYGGSGMSSSAAYGGYGAPGSMGMMGGSSYGGYSGGAMGTMGGMGMAPQLTLGDLLATLSGTAKGFFRARVMGIYVPENRPTELGGIVRDFVDVGYCSMRKDEARNLEGTGDYFTMIAEVNGEIGPKRIAGEHYGFGELYVEIPQGRTYNVGDSWSSAMTVVPDFTKRQVKKVTGQHEIQAVEWVHGRKCVRIHSTYEYKGDMELKLADWTAQSGGGGMMAGYGGSAGYGSAGYSPAAGGSSGGGSWGAYDASARQFFAMGRAQEMGAGVTDLEMAEAAHNVAMSVPVGGGGGGYGMGAYAGYGGYGLPGTGGMMGQQQVDPRIVKCTTEMTGEQTTHFAFELGRIERIEETNKHKLKMDVGNLTSGPQAMGGYGGYGEGGGYGGYGGYPGAGGYGGYPGTSGYGGYGGSQPPQPTGRSATPGLPRPPTGYPRGGDQLAMGMFGPVMPNVGPAGEVAAGYRPRLPARGAYDTEATGPAGPMGYAARPGYGSYGSYGSGMYGGSMPGAYGGGYGGMGGRMKPEIKIDRTYEVHVIVEARD